MNEITASCPTIISGLLKGATLFHDELVTGGIESSQVSVSWRPSVSASVS